MKWMKKIAGLSARKRTELALGLGLLLAVGLTGMGSFSRVCGQVRANTLRLHIRAASDSQTDQADKLAVRDAVVEAAAQLFGGADTLADAERRADENLEALQKVAQDTLRARGSGQPVQVYRTRMYFSTTHYDGFTMPAGQYDALRIDIGAAQGKNWWCVLFPALCVPAAESQQSAAIYTEEEQKVLESGYEIRFAAVELWQRLWNSGPVYDGI